MPSSRPEGYHFARGENGLLVVQENDPGLGACRIHYKPTGEFYGDREHEFRVSMDLWNKIVTHAVHEQELKKARQETAAASSKVKAPKVARADS